MVRGARRPRPEPAALVALQVAQGSVRVLGVQEGAQPCHALAQVLGPGRLEVVVPVGLGPVGLVTVNDGIELGVVCNTDRLAGVADVLALDGVHGVFRLI